jgi:hypothetical protein
MQNPSTKTQPDVFEQTLEEYFIHPSITQDDVISLVECLHPLRQFPFKSLIEHSLALLQVPLINQQEILTGVEVHSSTVCELQNISISEHIPLLKFAS